MNLREITVFIVNTGAVAIMVGTLWLKAFDRRAYGLKLRQKPAGHQPKRRRCFAPHADPASTPI
jgi:hypothetical protein